MALDVSITTLWRWEREGELPPERTAGGRRRYDLVKLKPELFRAAPQDRTTIAYARVSLHDQKDDPERQKQVPELYCARKGWTCEVIADLGSGMHYHKKGVQCLRNAVIAGDVGRLVITHTGRLLRFVAELVFAISEAKNVEVVILNQGESTTVEEDLVGDVLAIITVCSSRLYGSHGRKNQKRIDGMKKAVEEAQTCRSRIQSHLIPTTSRSPLSRRLAAWRVLPTTGRRSSGRGNMRPTNKADPSLPKPSEDALRRRPDSIKREHFPWMPAATKNAPQMAIIRLDEVFKNFFAGRAGYPQFRKKGKDDRFTLTNDQVRIDGCRIRIPNLGRLRMRESLRFAGKIIAVDTDNPPKRPVENQGVVGVDLDVSAMATLSTGEKIADPKPHTALLKRLCRLSRSLSRIGKDRPIGVRPRRSSPGFMPALPISGKMPCTSSRPTLRGGFTPSLSKTRTCVGC